MCKKFLYTFLHFLIFDYNDYSNNKIEPIVLIDTLSQNETIPKI